MVDTPKTSSEKPKEGETVTAVQQSAEKGTVATNVEEIKAATAEQVEGAITASVELPQIEKVEAAEPNQGTDSDQHTQPANTAVTHEEELAMEAEPPAEKPGFFRRALKATGNGIVRGAKGVGRGVKWMGGKLFAIPVGAVKGIYGTQKQYREESATRTKIINEAIESIQFLKIGTLFRWSKKVIKFPFQVAAAPLLGIGRFFETFAHHSGLQKWFAENVGARYKKSKAWIKEKFVPSEENQ